MTNFRKTLSLILFLACVWGGAVSQQARYSFVFRETSLADVIKEVSAQSKINILYNPNILPTDTKISGVYKNFTLVQALDTLFKQSQIRYKLYKKDIVLFKKNEEIRETHQIVRPDLSKRTSQEKQKVTFTDTITYSIITLDTVVTTLTDYVKIQVKDTVKVYDTIEVVRKVVKTVMEYKNRDQTFILGASVNGSFLFSSLKTNGLSNELDTKIKATLKAQYSAGVNLSISYRYQKLMFETGISWLIDKYSLHQDESGIDYITKKDTIDRYFTNIIQGDTTWVFVTEDRIVESRFEKKRQSDLRYQYLSIPLIVGYSTVFKNFTFEFKGGILFNYYVGSSGYYLKPTASMLEADNKKAPEAKYNFGLMTAFAVDYFLNENFHLFLQPTISVNPLVISKQQVDYYFSLSGQIGIKAGLRYYF